jgi:hypothetical protein
MSNSFESVLGALFVTCCGAEIRAGESPRTVVLVSLYR